MLTKSHVHKLYFLSDIENRKEAQEETLPRCSKDHPCRSKWSKAEWSEVKSCVLTLCTGVNYQDTDCNGHLVKPTNEQEDCDCNDDLVEVINEQEDSDCDDDFKSNLSMSKTDCDDLVEPINEQD